MCYSIRLKKSAISKYLGGIEHFVLVIKIRRVERRYHYLVLVESEK